MANSQPKEFLGHIKSALDAIPPYRLFGKVTAIQGLTITASLSSLNVAMGCLCRIHKNGVSYLGEVVAMTKNATTIVLSSPINGLGVGDDVEYVLKPLTIAPDLDWRGRILNAFGEAVDDKGLLPFGKDHIDTKGRPIPAPRRQRVIDPLDLGVRSLNAFVPACNGQRLGIFAGSGVGKSVLLSMLAKFAVCDVCVIGLVGERGRELKEFIEDTLGETGLRKSVVVVATSDEPPLARRQAAYTTLTIAEYFRDQGMSVLCIIDSLTRFAMAQREIGLSAGEPPTTKGYPPSVFSELAQLCERAGPGLEVSENGSVGGTITGLFSVLVDGDDHNEPIADAVRGILDGHIVLDRKIAERGIYPAVNVLKSISRLSNIALNKEQQNLVSDAKRILSVFDDMSDLIRMGAYQSGANFDVDVAIKVQGLMEEGFFKQSPNEYVSTSDTFHALSAILKK